MLFILEWGADMSILQYETRVSPEGYITLPPIPEYRNRKVAVCVDECRHNTQGDDTPGGDEQPSPAVAAEAGFVHRTPEERREAYEDFMKSWKGCLKGIPYMTAKEIRAERLEKKYGIPDKEGGAE